MVKWKGDLNRSIKWEGPGAEPETMLQQILAISATKAERKRHREAWNAAYAKIHEEQIRKIKLLGDHYGVDPGAPGAMFWLLLRLASDTVPGFKIDFAPAKVGRPRKWSDPYIDRKSEIVADVESVKRRRSCSSIEACRILLKGKKYKTRYDQYKNARTIENEYRKAQKPDSLVSRIAAMTQNDVDPDFPTNLLIAHFAIDQEAVEQANKDIEDAFRRAENASEQKGSQ